MPSTQKSQAVFEKHQVHSSTFSSTNYNIGRKIDPKDALASRRQQPGPCAYSLPGAIEIKTNKRFPVQNFNQVSPRFRSSPLDASKTTGNKLGPGAYKTVNVEENSSRTQFARADLNKKLEKSTFHRLRDLFPEKISISSQNLVLARKF